VGPILLINKKRKEDMGPQMMNERKEKKK